jgi:hypothetical protein
MMQAAPLITEELLDEDFFAELDALIDKDFEENKEIQEENRNCGTGAVGGKQGFQPGNKCAGTGEKSQGKGEGKKKNVHADWTASLGSDEMSNMKNWNQRQEVAEMKGREIEDFMTTFETSDGTDVDVTFESVYSDKKVFGVAFEVDERMFTAPSRTDAMEVFRGVAMRTKAFYDLSEVNGIMFEPIPDGKFESRQKLYRYLTKKISKNIPGLRAVENSDGTTFAVVNDSLDDEWVEKEIGKGME